MARNEPSALQIILDEVRALRADMRIELAAQRADTVAVGKRANDAHARLDDLNGRWRGVAWVSSTLTAAIGIAVTVWAKTR